MSQALVTDYYNQTAEGYDGLHDLEQEHVRALERSLRFVSDRKCKSIVDVGCGTGRALDWYSQNYSGAKLTGIDPSVAVLSQARRKVPNAEFYEGVGERLPFPDASFDIAVATGILHHVQSPKQTIAEMFRVARHGVIISDHNNFAFGGSAMRRLRLCLYSVGLLGSITFIKQGFKRQGYSKEDGWWFPYSLFDDFDVIAEHADTFFVMPTRPRNSSRLGSLMLNHSHVCVFAEKRPRDGRKNDSYS